MTTTIKMGQCQEPILKCLHQHGGSFAAAEVTAEVITSMGAASEGDAGKKSRQAVTNAAFELRQRHCMTSKGKGCRSGTFGGCNLRGGYFAGSIRSDLG